MRSLLFLCILSPLVVSGHAAGATVPAPIPVMFAVYAGVGSVIATWVLLLWKKNLPLRLKIIRLPRPVPLLLVGLILLGLLSSYYYGIFAFAWWFGVMTLCMFFASLVSMGRYKNDTTQVSYAPAILFLLFCGEFFVSQFQTNEGLFYVVMWYALLCVLCAVLFGEKWIRHEVMIRTITALGAQAPIQTHSRIYLPTSTDRWILVILIVATSFDGLLHSQYWRSFQAYFAIPETATMYSVLFFAGAVCIFMLAYMVTVLFLRDDINMAHAFSIQEIMNHFAPAFVPIAVGYSIAHNLSRIPYLFSESVIIYTWLLQIIAIIIGHIISVIVSHQRARTLFSNETQARHSQVSLTVFMMIITGMSIIMLQAPL